MIFKVDFEKACDSLSWDYLFEIMNITGFRSNWCDWIRAILSLARALVLVRGVNESS